MKQDNNQKIVASNNSSLIKFDFGKIENDIKLLINEKNKLEDLLKKITSTKDDLINSNLSGKTYDKSIENNELFEKLLTTRIATLNKLINKLEKTYNNYLKHSSDVEKTIN